MYSEGTRVHKGKIQKEFTVERINRRSSLSIMCSGGVALKGVLKGWAGVLWSFKMASFKEMSTKFLTIPLVTLLLLRNIWVKILPYLKSHLYSYSNALGLCPRKIKLASFLLIFTSSLVFLSSSWQSCTRSFSPGLRSVGGASERQAARSRQRVTSSTPRVDVNVGILLLPCFPLASFSAWTSCQTPGSLSAC